MSGVRGEAIQRAAQALWEHDDPEMGLGWDEVAEWMREPYYERARVVLGLVCERVEARRDRVVWRGLESESNSTEALTLNWVLVLLRGGADQ